MLHEWKKKGLGRGLSALFGDEKPKDKTKKIKQSNTVSISDLSEIHINQDSILVRKSLKNWLIL